MDGIRLNDLESLEACGANKQKIVEEITRAYAHQIYVDGFFNGDPHTGIPSLLLAQPLVQCLLTSSITGRKEKESLAVCLRKGKKKRTCAQIFPC
jgi:hypothetical protein